MKVSDLNGKDVEISRLKRHGAAVRENLKSIWDIKDAIGLTDWDWLAQLWDELEHEDKIALWVAPRDGGIFTTEERKALKSDEFLKARQADG